MDDQQLSDQIEIQQLCARYMMLSARKDNDHWRDVFTEDGTYNAFGTPYTLEHFPMSKREGGKKAVENAILAHRLCNRIDYSITDGRSYASDLERIRKARVDAIRRNKQGPDAATRI